MRTGWCRAMRSVNQARFCRVEDANRDVAGGDHDFDGGNAALVVGATNETLGDDGLEVAQAASESVLLGGGRPR